jgi:hypothetical protein
MTPRRLLLTALLLGPIAAAQPPADPPGSSEDIKAAHKLLTAAAKEYDIRVGQDAGQRPLELVPEPVLKWSNPAASDIQGAVFVWARDGRPAVAGSFQQWFTPRRRMEHEFHSLTGEGVAAAFHGRPVWKTADAGVAFTDIPGAPAPAAGEAPRQAQLKQLAKGFAATAAYKKEAADTELRLLPRALHAYGDPRRGVPTGGLFAFVRGTDPELLLMVEARGGDAARWQFAAARLTNNAALRLRYQGKQVWVAEPLAWGDIHARHASAYTAFVFGEIPEFLRDAATPKP